MTSASTKQEAGHHQQREENQAGACENKGDDAQEDPKEELAFSAPTSPAVGPQEPMPSTELTPPEVVVLEPPPPYPSTQAVVVETTTYVQSTRKYVS